MPLSSTQSPRCDAAVVIDPLILPPPPQPLKYLAQRCPSPPLSRLRRRLENEAVHIPSLSRRRWLRKDKDMHPSPPWKTFALTAACWAWTWRRTRTSCGLRGKATWSPCPRRGSSARWRQRSTTRREEDGPIISTTRRARVDGTIRLTRSSVDCTRRSGKRKRGERRRLPCLQQAVVALAGPRQQQSEGH